MTVDMTLDLVGPCFQGVNRNVFFIKKHYLPTVEIKDYNVVIDWRKFFDRPTKNDLKTYTYIRKYATGQCDDYTTGCLLDYPYFGKYYKSIAIDLSKQ